MKRKVFNNLLLILYLIIFIANSFAPNLMEVFLIKHKGIMEFRILSFIFSAPVFIFIILSLLFNKKQINGITSFIAFPLYVINLFFFRDLFNVYVLNSLELAIAITEMVYSLILLLYIMISKYFIKEVRWKSLLYYLAVLIFCIPMNFFMRFDSLRGIAFFNYQNFNGWHIFFLFSFILAAILLYYFLKNKNKEYQFLTLFTLSLILFEHFLMRFSFVRLHVYQDISNIIGALPLYVCSFGIVMLPLALYFKSPIFKGFLFMINTPGAIIVLVYPSIKGVVSIFHYDVTYFFFTHILLFAITLNMTIFLKTRFRYRDLSYVAGFLFIYFFTMIVLNSIVINFLGFDPNFSFVSTSPIPLMVKQLSLKIGAFTVYILYVLILYLVHLALASVTCIIANVVANRKISQSKISC